MVLLDCNFKGEELKTEEFVDMIMKTDFLPTDKRRTLLKAALACIDLAEETNARIIIENTDEKISFSIV